MGNFSILRLICWPIYPAIHPYTPLKKKWKTSNFRKTKKEKKKQIKIMISLSRVYLHNILCCLLHGILESLGCFIASFHRTWDVRDSFSLRFLDIVHGIRLTLRSPSWMQLWKRGNQSMQSLYNKRYLFRLLSILKQSFGHKYYLSDFRRESGNE